MLRTKKAKVAIAIQGMPSSNKFRSMLPKIKPRVILTTWVKGRKAKTAYWPATGKRESGKNVLLRKVIGVTSRKDG